MARLFLADNGYRLRFEPTEAIHLMEDVAAGARSETELVGWLRQRMTLLDNR